MRWEGCFPCFSSSYSQPFLSGGTLEGRKRGTLQETNAPSCPVRGRWWWQRKSFWSYGGFTLMTQQDPECPRLGSDEALQHRARTLREARTWKQQEDPGVGSGEGGWAETEEPPRHSAMRVQCWLGAKTQLLASGPSSFCWVGSRWVFLSVIGHIATLLQVVRALPRLPSCAEALPAFPWWPNESPRRAGKEE